MNRDDIPGLPVPLSGRTRIYAILGDPIAQVGSPRLFNSEFRRRQTEAVLVPMHVGSADLAALLASFRAVRNFDGLVVTVPHKIDIAAMVDEVGPMARRIGAVNAIRKNETGRLIGDNFDGAGFIQGVAKHGHGLRDRNVLVIGAGGAGRAVAHAIVDEQPASMGVFDVDTERSRALAAELAPFGPARQTETSSAAGFDVVVNCTSIGMHPEDPLPCSLEGFADGGLIVDIVLKPPRTKLLDQGAQRGCSTVEGVHMLEGQISAICDFFAIAQPASDAHA